MKAKKRRYWVIGLIVVFIFNFCSCNQSSESDANSLTGETSTDNPPESCFSLSATEIPSSVKVGEDISFTATLSNQTNETYYISFGLGSGDVDTPLDFYFYNVNSPISESRAAVLVSRNFNEFERIAQQFTCTPTEPGEYVLKISAGFSINDQSYSYALDEIHIQVEE